MSFQIIYYVKRLYIKKIFHNKDQIILRDYLALERTRLANERTLLAYSRTSLYMLLAGIAFLQLKDFTNIIWVGYLSIVLSLILILAGIYRHFLIKYRLTNYYINNNEPDE